MCLKGHVYLGTKMYPWAECIPDRSVSPGHWLLYPPVCLRPDHLRGAASRAEDPVSAAVRKPVSCRPPAASDSTWTPTQLLHSGYFPPTHMAAMARAIYLGGICPLEHLFSSSGCAGHCPGRPAF